MKKIKTMLVSLLMLITCLFCFVGCGATGKYNFKEIRVTDYYGDEEVYEAGDEFQGMEIPEGYCSLELKNDETFCLAMKYPDGSSWGSVEWKTQYTYGTWRESDGEIELMAQGSATTATLDGNTLTIESNGSKIVMTK